MDFEKICMMFTMQEPYYGILLSSMVRTPIRDRNIMPTLGVTRTGNQFKLGYNPDFIEKLSVDTAIELCKHECLHVAFNHFALWDTPPSSKEEHQLRNIAEDLEINGYLDRSKIDKMAGGVFAEDYGWPTKLGTREYYKRLKQMAQQQAQAKQPNKPCNGGQGGQSGQQQNNQQTQNQVNQNNQNNQGNQNSQNNQNNQQQSSGGQQNTPQNGQPQNSPGNGSSGVTQEFLNQFNRFDDHSKWPDGVDKAELEQLEQVVNELLDFAAQEVEKAHGTIPGELVGKIQQIRKKPKPAADWKRFFRRYLGNEFSEIIRKSKKRESKRFPDAPGNRHRRKSHILVAIDTSGSVSMPEYNEFFGQIKTLRNTATFHVVECDTMIHHEYDYTGNQNQILHGGGGTDFQEPIDLFIKERKKYDALVYFTDGYSDIPKNTPKETLWVISSQGDHNRQRYKVNGASVVFIPEK